MLFLNYICKHVLFTGHALLLMDWNLGFHSSQRINTLMYEFKNYQLKGSSIKLWTYNMQSIKRAGHSPSFCLIENSEFYSLPAVWVHWQNSGVGISIQKGGTNWRAGAVLREAFAMEWIRLICHECQDIEMLWKFYWISSWRYLSSSVSLHYQNWM